MIDTTLFQDKTALYFTLGCKLNFSETSTIARLLQSVGVREVRAGEKADICVINTCSVTEVAEQKGRQAIHRIIKDNPGAFVIVTGCYAQLNPQKLASIEGVDLVMGADRKGDILNFIDFNKRARGECLTKPIREVNNFIPSCSRGDRTRYFLKVQDGCNYYCTYCTIPFARGNSRNAPIASLVQQAREAAAEGGHEIVLTGVNIGDFGRSTGETFFNLVKALDRVEEIDRYRISSIEPNLLTEEIIDFVAQSRAFMPHFHIPLQSGSDEVLRLMHRRYDTAFFAQKIAYVKKVIPHAFIGVDVIVGTRGESDALFEECEAFLRGLDVSQLHVFPYSERPGTQALKIEGAVPQPVKHSRCQRLMELSEEKRLAFYARHRGETATVLFERPRTRLLHGFTPNYIRVEVEGGSPAWENQLMQVRLLDFNDDKTALKGEIVKE